MLTIHIIKSGMMTDRKYLLRLARVRQRECSIDVCGRVIKCLAPECGIN